MRRLADLALAALCLAACFVYLVAARWGRDHAPTVAV